jgi:hypothetical protein
MFGTEHIAKLITVVVIAVVLVGGLWYVSNLKADLAISEENSKQLTSAVEGQKEVIEGIRKDQETINQMNEDLRSVIKSQNKDVDALRDRFEKSANGEKRDFGKAAAVNPASVEKAVNRGTVNALRCLEIASGSPLTEVEKNATKPDEINKECPSLANPKYSASTSN